jgi:uncharacterized protein (DUF2342 family)
VEHQFADREVAHAVGLDGALDRLLRHARHHQQPFLQIVEALLKLDARRHQPNLPVM